MATKNRPSPACERGWSWWGRVIFYVADVDALYDRALAAGCQPTTAPRDAEWGERYFHLVDPDGHELSFACLLRSAAQFRKEDGEHDPACGDQNPFAQIAAWVKDHGEDFDFIRVRVRGVFPPHRLA